MTSQLRLVRRRPSDTQKVQLSVQLSMLEHARNKVVQQLRTFTDKVFEEVLHFLNSSFSPTEFSDLSGTLRVKCEAVEKFYTLLKDLTVESQVCTKPNRKHRVRNKELLPLRDTSILLTDVLKFGPMLQNSLMASSTAKAMQVLRGTLSREQLKHVITSPPAAVQGDEMTCGISSSSNNTVVTTSSLCRSEAEVSEVVFEKACQTDAEIQPFPISQSPKTNTDRPQFLLPFTAILPDTRNPKPSIVPPISAREPKNYVKVQQRKQTSSQLLHFLKAKAKSMNTVEFNNTEWHKHSIHTTSLQPPVSPVQTNSSGRVNNDVTDLLALSTSRPDMENQEQIFRVERVKAGCPLSYTCMIATKTELWDFLHINAEQGQGNLNNPCVKVAYESRYLFPYKKSKPDNESVGTKMPNSKFNSITIPQFQMSIFDETEVKVSHIIDPGHFYIQRADSVIMLQALITNSWKAVSSYAERNCIPDIGTLVMGWFPEEQQWCRAQVTRICGISEDNNPIDGSEGELPVKVEVKRLDYGDTSCLVWWNIQELTQEMACLSVQSMQVSLANVMPVNGNGWSEEAVDWFRAVVHNRTLYARLYTHGSSVTVELFLEKGRLGAMRRSASMSLRLIQSGHAKHSKLKNVGPQEEEKALLHFK